MQKTLKTVDDSKTPTFVLHRIPYVYIQSPDGDRGYNKTEDPVFVMQHGLPVDLMYYYEHQVSSFLSILLILYFFFLLWADSLNFSTSSPKKIINLVAQGTPEKGLSGSAVR